MTKNTFFFTKEKNNICLYDKNLKFIKVITTHIQYLGIAHIEDTNQFILSTKTDYKNLYLVNECFEQIKIIPLANFNTNHEKIQHIFYSKNTLTITTDSKICLFTIDGNFIKIIYQIKEVIKKNYDYFRPLIYKHKIKLLSCTTINNENYVVYSLNNIYYLSKIVNFRFSPALYTSNKKIKNIFIKDNFIWITQETKDKLKHVCTGKVLSKVKSINIYSPDAINKDITILIHNEIEHLKDLIKNLSNSQEIILVNDSLNKLMKNYIMFNYITNE